MLDEAGHHERIVACVVVGGLAAGQHAHCLHRTVSRLQECAGHDQYTLFVQLLRPNTWSDHVDVTVASFDADQTSELLALGDERIDAAPTIAAATERIRRRASQVVRSLDHLGAGDPLTGRIADIAADAWMLHVVLAHNPNPDELAALQSLDRDLAAAGRAAVAVAVTTPQEAGRWPLSIDPAGRLTITFLGMTGDDASLTSAGLPRTELTNLAGLLNTARRSSEEGRRAAQPELERPEDWPPVPPAPEPEPWAQGTDAAGSLINELLDPADADAQADENHDAPDETPDPEPDLQPAPASAQEEPPAAAGPPQPPRAEAPDQPPANPAAQIPAVVPLARRQLTTRRVTAPLRSRRHSDPSLDADMGAWTDADPSRPRIAILGPVTLEAPGQEPTERLRFYAEIIVYHAVRGARGATTDQFDEASGPDNKSSTRWPGRSGLSNERCNPGC